MSPSWRDWCDERLEEARQIAVKRGVFIEDVMLHTRHHYANDIAALFPGMDLSKALEELGGLACAADRERRSRPAQGPLPIKTWEEWCRECVEEARGYATQNGTGLEVAMLRILSMLIPETRARFPDLELSQAIHEIAWHACMADHEARGTSG